MNEIFRERERGFEAEYFRRQDELLLEKMRHQVGLTAAAVALADRLNIDSVELLGRMVELGLTRDTGAAILLAPLVQVAWAEGKVTHAERKVVLKYAEVRGMDPESPPYQQLEEWLDRRPSDAVFGTALETLKVGLATMTPAERDERIKALVDACHRVAEASGGGLLRLIGLTSGVSHNEELVLDTITEKLRVEERHLIA